MPDDRDKAMLNGEAGNAAAFAFEILAGFAASIDARGFIDIAGSHIDGCLGQVGRIEHGNLVSKEARSCSTSPIAASSEQETGTDACFYDPLSYP